MVSLKQKQSGFTIVELLIVIVIIGILAGLVITTFVGIQQRARNSERQTDINSISNQLEAYFAKNSGYPTLANLNDPAWRSGNDIKMGDNDKALADPSSPTVTTLSATTPTATGNAYSYNGVGPASCVSPTDATGAPNSGTFCDAYTLTAFQEGGQPVYTKNSAN
jgi:general secretion pathway protein G